MKRIALAVALVVLGACAKDNAQNAGGTMAADTTKHMAADTTKKMGDTSAMKMADTSKKMMADTSKKMMAPAAKAPAKKP
ncbi:MAG TPA: hypothetical protein VN674_09750 [Gemmatimonadales bacterium]|nr:hypothetical protein [Gemmatimonadales bacterium]